MATSRLAWRRLAARKLVPAFESPVQRRFAGTQASNVPNDMKAQAKVIPRDHVQSKALTISQKEATLPNPDPAEDSATMAFIKDRNPYLVPTYVRPAPMMIKGQGCYLWDMENRRYLDFTAGIAVNALGHCDPEIAQIIAEQVRIHVLRFMALL
jgi:acetylornithine aminotransferase